MNVYRFFWFLVFLSFPGFSQHQEKVDFIKATVLITPKMSEKSIEGKVFYDVDILQDIDSIWLDAKNMDFDEILLNDRRIKWNYDEKRIVIKSKFKKDSSHKLYLEYKCTPKQTVYFVGLEDENPDNDQVWTQGQGKYTSHWLPSFDDMEEKVEFDLSISTIPHYEVIANGKLIQKGVDIWKFDMEKPMSSYLLAFAIGKYGKRELTSKSGIPIENYFYPKDSLKVEPTYRYTKDIFDFLENEIGVAYPWQNYKQVPVHDFLYAGMENTGATIFSDGYVVDSTAFIDRNYVNINAHELAHQWFGNLITEKDGNHHWLHEGFATYYAYLAEKELFGEDHFYWKLYDTAIQLEEISKEGKGESLLNPKASSLTFYEKGAWALAMLKEEIGEEAFKKGVQSYLKKFEYRNVTVDDFLTEMALTSNQTLNDFRGKWLASKEFPWADVKNYLVSKNESLKTYFSLEDEMNTTEVWDTDKLFWFWNRETPIQFKTHLVSEFNHKIPDSTILKIFENEPALEIRQALSISASPNNKDVKEKFESLLLDKSYLTKEYSLFKLWQAFPEDRAEYLNLLENIDGLPNKNVRLLWLTLALVTPDYKEVDKKRYLEELVSYTGANFNPEIRQTAFQYLYQINGLNTKVLKELILATNHHSWQFRTYVRDLLDEILKIDTFKEQIIDISKQLKSEDLRYLKTKMDLP